MYMCTSGSPDSQVEIVFCCVIWPCYRVQGTVARNPLRVGLTCTPLIHGHLPGTATHIKVLHTPSPSCFLSFALHILISYSLFLFSSPPTFPPPLSTSTPSSLTSPAMISWFSREWTSDQWGYSLSPSSPTAGVCCPWSFFAPADHHCSPSARGPDCHCSPGETHGKWKYVTLPNPNTHPHQTHSIHGLMHTLPPSLHSTQSLIRERYDNHNNCLDFLEEPQLCWTCTSGNQQHLCWY